jgi:hypothetical protein
MSFVLIIGLAACTDADITKEEDNNNTTTKGENGNNTADEEKKENKNEPEVFSIGDTVQFNDLKITLVNVREVHDEVFQPENDKFVAVELAIDNTGDESQTISTLMSMQFLADGYQQDQTVIDVKGSLDGEVAPGRTMKGEVAFDITTADSYEYIFEDPFTFGQAFWKINEAKLQNNIG